MVEKGYESIFIVNPDLGEQEQADLVTKLTQVVTKEAGKVLHHVVWGKRKLAYPVKKHLQGIYHVFYLDHSHGALRALENAFRLNDPVLKWMSVLTEDVEEAFGEFEKLRQKDSDVPRTQGAQVATG